MSDIALDYRVPPADLQPFVTLFYHFRADVAVFEDVERADHAQLRFRLAGDRASYTFPDGSCQPAAAIHVVGPTSGAVHTRCDGPVVVVGMGLQPAGWAAAVGLDASALLNRTVDAHALWGPSVDEARMAMGAAAGVDARVAVAESFVRRLIAGVDSGTLALARQVDTWLAGSPSPDVEDLARRTGLSRRQVERRCKALYGAPPKLLARKYRALRAAVALASGGDPRDPAVNEGFYDQSHLIREIKHFTGLTPRQMRGPASPLAQHTIHQRVALGGKVHRIISET